MTISFGIGHSGSSPSPFDALDGHLLAGPDGSHPLHHVDAAMLLRPQRGPIQGAIELAAPSVRVGEVMEGRLRLASPEGFEGRLARFRLVGLRLVEERKSVTHRDSKGNVTSTERWVEANGTIFTEESFVELVVPAQLSPGQAWESAFRVPAPRLGPPSAHLGEAIVAWALEVRWDKAWSEDPVIAALVQVDQHPDLLRAGVGKQGGMSLLGQVSVDGGSISVPGRLPARIGEPFEVQVNWPGAPDGRGARVELHRRTNCPNGEVGIIASAPAAIADLRSGSARVSLAIPAGSPPSFDGAGLEINYIVRVLVDRQFRSDAAIERPIGVA